MDINGLLTFVALLIAVYALLPRNRRLDLSYRVGVLDYILAIETFVVVIYLQYYHLFAASGLDPFGKIRNTVIGLQDVSLFLIIIVSFILYIHIRYAPFSKRRIVSFRELFDELYNSNSHSELLSLLDKHFDSLFDLYTKESGNEKIQTAVAHIFQIVLLRDEFARSTSRLRPYFALKILPLNIHEKYEFIDNYFRELMSDPSSILFFEIKNNQNIDTPHRYWLPKTNRLLYTLFKDTRTAEKLSIWKPVGESVLMELDEYYHLEGIDNYNLGMEKFHDVGCWKSSIFVAIRFFDIMVSEAIYQNIEWHMWLPYFRYFTERICRNYDPVVEYVDLTDTFPTKYTYLLYEMILTLNAWISLIKDVPEGQVNVILHSTDLVLPGNIIEVSIVTLVRCIRSIITTPKIPLKFKRDTISTALDTYYDFRQDPNRQTYAKALLNVFATGGSFADHNYGDYLGVFILAVIEKDNTHFDRDHVCEVLQSLVSKFFEKYSVDELRKFVDVELTGSSISLSAERGNRYSFEI